MSRHLFGLSAADLAMEKVGDEVRLRAGAVGTVWDALVGGTQITDLTDLAGNPITQITADTEAAVGFYGPDGVSTVYADFGYSRRFLMMAVDLGDQIDSLSTNKLDLTGGTMLGPIITSGVPSVSGEAVNKAYVDSEVSSGDAATFTSAQAYTDAQAALKVSKAGDAMTGPLTLPGNPTSPLHAATKQYVDALGGGGSGAVSSVNGQTGVVNLTAANVGALATTARGSANGVASLDAATKVPTNQIPDLTSTYLAFEDSWGNQWGPADQGLKAWSFDPSLAVNVSAPVGGSVYLIRVKLRKATTISKVVMFTVAAGSGLTANQNYAGLYTASGTRVGITANQSSAWTTANNTLSMSLTSAYSAAAGDYYVAFVSNGSTRPGFVCGTELGATRTAGNANLSSGGYRYCIGATGQTSLPSSISIASATPDANAYWVGLA
ncbi:hypothetical protein [Streptomyces aurantiogriseus]|uniref:Uncharacterized protein n=1 Tax=Streptomyces aurantiogriseus TaxID=66870 RepID=A0A918FBJ5_9ACTN|nr:hypothetical protein [Streptomyces aurantiogriseus]GGR24234.1 hypothetical protein GCM10010251_45390 [Streptomyces aurantiogriseus]